MKTLSSISVIELYSEHFHELKINHKIYRRPEWKSFNFLPILLAGVGPIIDTKV